jgi:hypothetical protein
MISKHSHLWAMLSVGILPIMLIFAAFIGTAASGQIDLNEWTVPIIGMSSMGLLTILLLGSIIALLIISERIAISRLINHKHWVKWPQYDDEVDWHVFMEREVATVREKHGIPWIFVIVLVVLFSFITGFGLHLMNTSRGPKESPLVMLLSIGTMFVFILISGLGQPVMQRRRGEALYRRRRNHSIPSVYIGEAGLYHEDTGYSAFRALNERLVEVKYVPRHRTLNFEIWHRSGRTSFIETVRVHVPHGAENEARDIEARLKAEVLNE